MHPKTDPSCLQLLTDLRALADTARALSTRCDREAGVVGYLWGVRQHLGLALDAAEAEIGTAREE